MTEGTVYIVSDLAVPLPLQRPEAPRPAAHVRHPHRPGHRPGRRHGRLCRRGTPLQGEEERQDQLLGEAGTENIFVKRIFQREEGGCVCEQQQPGLPIGARVREVSARGFNPLVPRGGCKKITIRQFASTDFYWLNL